MRTNFFMNINLSPSEEIFARYHSPSQRARVITEQWAAQNVFCPRCGKERIFHEAANEKARDFSCPKCDEVFEMKSKSTSFGNTINDGAYDAMLKRAGDDDSPSFFLLRYSREGWRAVNLEAIPRMFILPEMVIARKPLLESARRGAWVGCNIDISRVPESGRIRMIDDGQPVEPKLVVSQWKKITFLGDKKELPQRGWTIDIMREVDIITTKEFSLDDLYRNSTERLSILHPDNKHIHDKIRQQLQILRDTGYLKFLGNGRYSKV